VFGHQWLSRWLKVRRSRAKVEKLTSCSRGARLSRHKQLSEMVLCKISHVVWSHGDLDSSKFFSLARRKTTSCGNGWFETTRRHVYTTGIRLLYCETERPGNLPSYPSKQHYGLCRHKGKHSGSDVARLNKVCFPCRATRAGSKNRLLTGSTMMKNTMKLRLGTWKSSTTR